MAVQEQGSPTPLGRRERSKAQRRATIQRAALRQFARRGYEATSIADVADEADVARATVLLYFPSKLDMALSWTQDVGDRIEARFAAGPADDFFGILDRALQAEAEDQDPELSALAMEMFDRNPGLRALSRALLGTVAMGAATDAFAHQTGLTEADVRMEIVGSAARDVIESYLVLRLRGEAGPELHPWFMDYIERIFEVGAASVRSAPQVGQVSLPATRTRRSTG